MIYLNIADIGYRAKRLVEVVELLPGIHLREAQRRTGLGLGDAVYQLDKLESMGLIKSEKSGRYRRYYPPKMNFDDRKNLSVLLHPNRRLIVSSLLSEQTLNASDLAFTLRLSKSTAIWHLRILESVGFVTSSTDVTGSVAWRLADPEKAVRILQRHNPSALDRLSESFLQSWDLLGRT